MFFWLGNFVFQVHKICEQFQMKRVEVFVNDVMKSFCGEFLITKFAVKFKEVILTKEKKRLRFHDIISSFPRNQIKI